MAINLGESKSLIWFKIYCVKLVLDNGIKPMYKCFVRFGHIKEILGSQALLSAKSARNILYSERENLNNKVKENKSGMG